MTLAIAFRDSISWVDCLCAFCEVYLGPGTSHQTRLCLWALCFLDPGEQPGQPVALWLVEKTLKSGDMAPQDDNIADGHRYS